MGAVYEFGGDFRDVDHSVPLCAYINERPEILVVYMSMYIYIYICRIYIHTYIYIYVYVCI